MSNDMAAMRPKAAGKDCSSSCSVDVMLEATERQQIDNERRLNERLASLPLKPVILPVQVAPRPGESLMSVAFHASKMMGVAGAGALFSSLGWSMAKVPRPNQINQMGRSLRIIPRLLVDCGPLTIDDKSVYFRGHRLESRHVAAHDRRICPACVAEVGYGLELWQLRALNVCPQHRTPLVSQCQICLSPLSLSRPAYGRCRCGATYTPDKAPASDSAVLLARLIHAKFYGSDVSFHALALGLSPADIDAMPLAGLLDLVALLGMAQRDAGKFLLRKIDWPIVAEVGLSRFELAAGALTDWPRGLFARLRDLRMYEPWEDSAAQVSMTLDHVLRVATHNMQPDAGRLLLAGIGEFVRRPWEWSEHRRRAATEGIACLAS